MDQWKLVLPNIAALAGVTSICSWKKSGESGMRAHVWNQAAPARPAAVVPLMADHERRCLNGSTAGKYKGFTELTADDGARGMETLEDT